MSQNRLFPAEETLSVGQLVRRAKNALAREMRGQVWVHGEIRSIREHRGSWYLSLVQPGDYVDGGDISLDAACWPKRRVVIQSQLSGVGLTLAAGMHVRICGMVTLSKIGKLQIEVNALDVDALLGEQEAEKRRLFAAVAAEGLIDRQRRLPEPIVPLRIGLVTSEGSEGCNDFLGQLERSGFLFAVTLAHSPVQGPAASVALARAVDSLAAAEIDVIAVVRGGGGELDAFDKEAVVRAIAASPHPVWTGIGHTGDRSIADDVAQRAFITPTECGQAMVASVGSYVQRVDAASGRLSALADRVVEREARELERQRARLAGDVGRALTEAARRLHRQAERARWCSDRDLLLASKALHAHRAQVERSFDVAVDREVPRLRHLRSAFAAASRSHVAHLDRDVRSWRVQLQALDPSRQLQRGYSLTRTADGALVRDLGRLAPGDTLLTQFAVGTVTSTIEEVDGSGSQESNA